MRTCKPYIMVIEPNAAQQVLVLPSPESRDRCDLPLLTPLTQENTASPPRSSACTGGGREPAPQTVLQLGQKNQQEPLVQAMPNKDLPAVSARGCSPQCGDSGRQLRALIHTSWGPSA